MTCKDFQVSNWKVLTTCNDYSLSNFIQYWEKLGDSWNSQVSAPLWSESWTSYVESTGTSESNRFRNLVLQQPWEHMTHSMISWGSTNLMWPIPKKCSYLLSRNATCSVSFELQLQQITLTSFHRKNMFIIWPGGGFPLFVCGISQKKSVDLCFLGMNSSLLYFLQSPKWTVSFFSVSSTSQQLFLCFCQCW